MSKNKTTINEPLSSETLYFSPKHYLDTTIMQAIFIGVVEKDVCSFVSSQTLKGGYHGFTQFHLAEQEIDLLIKGLTGAKERMKNPSYINEIRKEL